MDRVGAARDRAYGYAAVCTTRVTNTAHYRGHRFDADEWTTDVFVRRTGRWLCVLTHITPAEPTRRSCDGIPGAINLTRARAV
jgi:hypothetical protein